MSYTRDNRRFDRVKLNCRSSVVTEELLDNELLDTYKPFEFVRDVLGKDPSVTKLCIAQGKGAPYVAVKGKEGGGSVCFLSKKAMEDIYTLTKPVIGKFQVTDNITGDPIEGDVYYCMYNQEDSELQVPTLPLTLKVDNKIKKEPIETVDNIKLDRDNVEFNNVAEFVRHTDKLVYLTGKAGTGKTTFLKYIRGTTNKNTVILAPTGVAAINAGGVTIHSFFQIPFGPFVPGDSRLRTKASGDENKETIYTTFKYNEEKIKIIESLELLIIDEISMVRADVLDVIDQILKVFRRKNNLPFGGVQVILIGDTFQLPPIVDNEQESILSQFYKTPFFFSSKVIENNKPIYIELKKIYRQNEQEFIDLLNRVRVSKMLPDDFVSLNSKYDHSFAGNGSDYIILATHNKIVNETNAIKLKDLNTEEFTYEAKVTGSFPDKNKPTDHFLKLKVGAQIMFIKNDVGGSKRFYNGKIGKVKELEDFSITVKFDDETEVEVERAVWNNIQYSYDKEQKKIIEEIIGKFEQFPIRLAWAITVHKSQGLTFEKVIADLGRAFAPGQVYVALSRCTSFSGLKLKTQLNRRSVKTDPRVLEFAQNETPGTLITEELNTGKADFFYKKAREDFKNNNVKSAFSFFKKALKFRNDIYANDFERYIEVQCKRLLSFREANNNLSEQLSLVNSKFEEAFDSLEFEENNVILKELQRQHLEEIMFDLEIRNEAFEVHLNKSESDFKKNNTLNKASKEEIERLNNEIKKRDSQLYDSEISLIQLHLKLSKAESDLKNKSLESNAYKDTIELLENKLKDIESEFYNSQDNSNRLKVKLNKIESELKNKCRENIAYKEELELLKNKKWYNKLFG